MEATERMAAIAADLNRERETISAAAQRLQDELVVLQSQRRRIDAAIAALTSASPKGPLKPTTKNVPKERRREVLPSPRKEQVECALRRLLAEEGSVPHDALEPRVAALLAADGFSRSGLALRLRQAAAEAKIVETPTGWQLADEEALATSHT